MKRLHIVGCPRSGTTLLMELVSTCFASGGYCEHELSIFEPVADVADVYFSKQPNDIRQLRHIFHRDEQLYVIYMGRDPRAVITSKHRENPGQYFCNYRVWHECDQAAQRYETHPRFLRLRYEDLVSDADAVQRQIVQRFGFLRQLHPFSEFHLHSQPSAASQRAMNGLREVNRESLDKWRQHLPRVAQQLRDHPGLAADLQRLGYEPDRQWTAVLEGVEPVLYPCRYPERKPRLKDWERDLRVYLKSRRYLRRRCP
ncbi:sulfotransferase [Seongchinamella sediminis]|nr:sulfotransferase [Seongchinamella sediminis]